MGNRLLSRRRSARRSTTSTASCNSGALLEDVYYGLSLGAVLLLAATGLAITFGVMGVINMAHGEMVMIGAYTTFVVQQLIAAFAPALERSSACCWRCRRRFWWRARSAW